MSSLCDEAVGIDPELTGIALAREKLRLVPNCSVARASCYELPFSFGSFDTVLLADVIEHLEDQEKCLQEICRVLSHEGTLLVTIPKCLPDRPCDRYHIKEFKPEELEALLRSSFSQVTMIFGWPIFWSRMYSTILARHLYNPFLREGVTSEGYGQILAVCRYPGF